jgi:hypothetical protein
MTSVLKPEITSIINGLLTITVRSTTEVAAVYNQLLIYRADSANGPFSTITTEALDGSSSYSYLDTETTSGKYYRVQYYNSGTLASSPFSELAQETGVFSEYTVPTTTATYPPEIALSENDREIVESIRVTLGDLTVIERDSYDSSEPTTDCARQISADTTTWEMVEWKGWPQRVILDGTDKTSLSDPQVLGYRYLTFSGGSSVVTGTLDLYYASFRFSDREILLAYDRARNLLASCGLEAGDITTEMLIMQAAILLLEGELREAHNTAVMIRDGDTTYDRGRNIMSRTEALRDLQRKLQEILDCARMNASMGLEGVRVE